MPSTDPGRRAPAPVDPRPAVVAGDDGFRVAGYRCTACRYPMQIAAHRCPRCAGEMAAAEFGPEGVTWSSTVLRIPIPGRETPYVLAWVNLADGPRIIAHVTGHGDRHLPAGTRVRLTQASATGDLRVEVAG